uniref:hypothetical protein n=2 Tax=Flavobacterium sp. TaxID=239 RepID=UPI0040497D2E
MKYFFLAYISSISLSFGQTITFVDSLTRKPIPDLGVKINAEYGFFTDLDGTYKVKVQSDSIKTFHINYATVQFKTPTEDTLILLKESSYVLQEVINASKKKKLILKLKYHNDASKNYFTHHSEIIFIKIMPESERCYLKKIILPILFDDNRNYNGYKTKAIVFCAETVEKGFEKMMIQEDKIHFFDTKDKKSNSIYFENTSIPNEGIYVGILFLGEVDGEDKLIDKDYFQTFFIKGEQIKTIKPIFPTIQLSDFGNDIFQKFIFSETTTIQSIKEGKKIHIGYEQICY